MSYQQISLNAISQEEAKIEILFLNGLATTEAYVAAVRNTLRAQDALEAHRRGQ